MQHLNNSLPTDTNVMLPDFLDFNPGNESLYMFGMPFDDLPWIILWSVLAIFGVFGNMVVMALIIRVVLNSQFSSITVYIYIFCLCASDFVYLLPSFLTIVTRLNQSNWIFGFTACKLLYFCEGLNKTYSVCLLVLLSWDRWMAICNPTSQRCRSPISAAKIIIISTFFVLFMNAPIL